MLRETWGDLSVAVAGGPDGKGGGSGPVVVLLHGFGTPGDDLVPLFRVLNLSREVRVVFPAAPLELALPLADARAWWMIDLDAMEQAYASGRPRDVSDHVPEGMKEAREKLSSLLDEVERHTGVPGDRIALGGFSQGAMLACDLALRTDRRFAGLALLSGTLLAQHEWTPLMSARKGMPVFLAHGRQDPLLPFEQAERLRDLFVGAGLNVEWVPFAGGHEIPMNVIEKLGTFLTTTFA